MIPQEKSAAVARALEQAFGTPDCDDISIITKGRTTSLVYRVVVGGSPYLLKIVRREEDCSRHFSSMQAAAGAGLAPRVLYASLEDRLVLTGFVDCMPLSRAEALVRMPGCLRALHALPPFLPVAYGFNTTCTFLLQKGPALDGLLTKFRNAGIFPKKDCEAALDCLSRLCALCSAEPSDVVSSHNDLFKPDNILFDGERMWLVDWEAAFPNDRYAELAVVANMLVSDDAEEEQFLTSYFGAPPTAQQRARLSQMRQLTNFFYAIAFLLYRPAGTVVDWDEPVPELSELQQPFWTGELALTDDRSKTLYGRAHWNQFLRSSRG